MTTKAQIRAQKKYDRTHTQSVMFKLNCVNDADILAKLTDVENRQGYVKTLIRRDIRGNSTVLTLDALRYLVRPVAVRYHLKTVYVFGSYATGKATGDSDIDMMIEGGNIDSAKDYFSVSKELSDVLGKSVDIVMAEAARDNHSRAGRRFLDHFERDKVLIYEDA